jgi:predicted ArsR family transcriptional regulator
MAESFKRREIKLTDPRALRAYAHPTRATLVGLLRTRGPLTATRAAELVGESVASCSYHLRQLAKYGLVEEDDSGQGREKPWRATAPNTNWPARSDDPAVSAAVDAVAMSFAEQYFERVMGWIERRAEQSPEWQDAALFGDSLLYLTADELEQLKHEVSELLGRYMSLGRLADRRPEGAKLVTFLHLAFPEKELPGEEPSS